MKRRCPNHWTKGTKKQFWIYLRKENRSGSFSFYTKKDDDLLSKMESFPFLMWMREVVCPGRGDRNPHKSSLKKAPQSHEKEFGLWRRRASLCRGVIGEESSTRGRWKEESARSARCRASELTFQSFQEHSNKWSIGCPSLFRKSGSSIYEIVPQAVEKKKSDRWRKSVQFSGRRKMSILKKTSTWVTRMDESKKNCLVDTDPMTVKSKANVLILWKDFSIQGKKRLIKTKMKRMRQRTEIDHQRTPQQSKKEKGKARKEQRLNHQIQHKALQIFRGLDYSLVKGT